MTMLYTFHENFEVNEMEMQYEPTRTSFTPTVRQNSKIHLFTEKICRPSFRRILLRPRLSKMLEKSSEQFGATLLLGRAGTGKTALAVDYSQNYENIAWYSIESVDRDWKVFSKYFEASFEELSKPRSEQENSFGQDISSKNVSYFVENMFARLAEKENGKQRLIVLDNAHNVFDSPWFTDFFHSLVCSLTPNNHLLVLSRSQPPLPLWRLRSKQALGVVNEKLLLFNSVETDELFENLGLSKEKANHALGVSFGRISKLKEISEAYLRQ